MFLKLEQILPHLGDVEGGAADAPAERTVAGYFCPKGVVPFEGDGMVDQLRERLVWGERKFLLFSKGRMGVRVSTGTKGKGVDTAVASMGEEEFGGEGVEVVFKEGSDGFNPIFANEVRELGGVPVLIVVDTPVNPWVETWQGFQR